MFFDLLWKGIYLVIFVVNLYALIEAIRTPAEAFPLMDKQSKRLWVGLLGVGTVLALSAVMGSFAIFVILSLIASLVFMLDVRPAVRGVSGNRNEGPYGPW